MGAPIEAGDDDDIVVGINVTPLVDVTLVLLVVFIVTAKLVVQQGVPMDLPKAASAGATQTVLTVSVDAAGQVAVNGQPADDGEVASAGRRAMKETPDTRVVVQAAGAARHERVLHVVDTLRGAGVVKVAFAADPAPSAER